MKKQFLALVALSAAGFLTACGNSAMATATAAEAPAVAALNPNTPAAPAVDSVVVGQVNNAPFTVRSAVYGVTTQGDQTGALVVLSDQNDYCDLLTRNVRAKNSATLTVQAFITDTSNNKFATLQTGDFNVLLPQTLAPGNVASVVYSQLDATCHDSTVHASTDATTGRLTVLSVQAPSFLGDPNFVGRASGVFNARAPNQPAPFGGAYNAVYCPALTLSNATAATCQ